MMGYMSVEILLFMLYLDFCIIFIIFRFVRIWYEFRILNWYLFVSLVKIKKKFSKLNEMFKLENI